MALYRYYCPMRPVAPGAVPRAREIIDFKHFVDRQYIPEIGREAWGWMEYSEPLSDTEIAEYELIEGIGEHNGRSD